MSEALKRASRIIEARIAEIDAEAAKLRGALASFAGAPAPRGRAKTKQPKRSGGQRAPHGRRREHVLAAVRKSPGASAAELGREVGISTNQAYGLAQRLVKDGEIKKRGKGYRAS
jgi:hypothetical protein